MVVKVLTRWTDLIEAMVSVAYGARDVRCWATAVSIAAGYALSRDWLQQARMASVGARAQALHDEHTGGIDERAHLAALPQVYAAYQRAVLDLRKVG